MNRDATYLHDCIQKLLEGLECQHIDDFMERITPENCLKLGKAYMAAVKNCIGISN